ncbi:hypothetical protein BC829DRAFT_61016 [Chytridium lagenaria]|nr:hypothetical protein BC829DRAFT_61016 [Chytridium lagenaria]
MPSTGRPSATNLVGNEAGNSREGRGNGSVVDLNGVRPTSAGSTTSAPSQHTPGNYPPGTPVDLQLQQQVSMNPMPKLFLPSTPFDDDNMDPTMDDGDDFSKTPQRGNPLLAAMAAQQRAQATPVPSAPLIIEDDVLEADVDDDVDVNLEDQDDDIMPLDDGGMETEQMEIEPLNEDEAEELKMEAADRVLSGEASGNATVRDMQEVRSRYTGSLLLILFLFYILVRLSTYLIPLD